VQADDVITETEAGPLEESDLEDEATATTRSRTKPRRRGHRRRTGDSAEEKGK